MFQDGRHRESKQITNAVILGPDDYAITKDECGKLLPGQIHIVLPGEKDRMRMDSPLISCHFLSFFFR